MILNSFSWAMLFTIIYMTTNGGLKNNSPRQLVLLLFRVALIFQCVFLAVRKLWSIIYRNRINHILKTKGVNDELKAIVAKQIRKSKDKVTRAKIQIAYASFMVAGGFYNECYEMLRLVDFNDIPEDYKVQYYSVYLRANLLENNILAADEIYSQGNFYFESTNFNNQNANILCTLGLYEFCKENYNVAKSIFIRAKNNSESFNIMFECEKYMAQCYLKLDQKDDAKKAVIDASKHADSVSTRKELAELMTLVENAYGVLKI